MTMITQTLDCFVFKEKTIVVLLVVAKYESHHTQQHNMRN